MSKMKASFYFALPYTFPICAGFLFLGMSYGFFMLSKGFPLYLPIITSALIFAGSMEFVLVELLLTAFNPIATFALTLMINARHIFYGLSMLDKFKHTGKLKPYLIFGMCDESFSINCNTEIPAEIDKTWFMFHVTWLNQVYWVCGATLGAILGRYLSFNTKGIEFVLTSLFLIIFIEQWLSQTSHRSALVGLGSSLFCLVLFGAKLFIIPSMLMILFIFTLFYKFEKKEEII